MSIYMQPQCPLCGSKNTTCTRNSTSAIVTHQQMQCKDCGTLWNLELRAHNMHIIKEGTPPKPHKSAESTVQDLYNWAHTEAFIRYDEPPRLTCDEINETLDAFIAEINQGLYKLRQEFKARF